MRGSETGKKNEAYVIFSVKDEVRRLRASERRKVVLRMIRADVK